MKSVLNYGKSISAPKKPDTVFITAYTYIEGVRCPKHLIQNYRNLMLLLKNTSPSGREGLWQEFAGMGKKERLARAAKKKKKFSVQVLGKEMGDVDDAVFGHKKRSVERLLLYEQAEQNIADKPRLFSKCGWKEHDVVKRMVLFLADCVV